jgi:hypothetical protein
MSKNKYIIGAKVASLPEFSERCEKNLPFYWRHKFMAVGFIRNWQVRMVINAIKHGVLFAAERVEK